MPNKPNEKLMAEAQAREIENDLMNSWQNAVRNGGDAIAQHQRKSKQQQPNLEKLWEETKPCSDD